MKFVAYIVALIGLILSGCATFGQHGLLEPNTSGHFAPIAASTAMSGQKLTGLGAGSAAGDSLRYEQAQQLLNGAVAVCDGSFSGAGTDTDTITIGADVYELDSGGGVTGGRIAVTIGAGAGATRDNLVSAINASGTVAVRADATTATEFALQSATAAGGTASAADPSISLSEAGTSFSWQCGNVNLNTLAGEALTLRKHAMAQLSVTTALVAVSPTTFFQFDFTPTRFAVTIRNSSGAEKLTISDTWAISGNRITWTSAGAVHVANGDVVLVEAWE